jgi:hypothetical protein
MTTELRHINVIYSIGMLSSKLDELKKVNQQQFDLKKEIYRSMTDIMEIMEEDKDDDNICNPIQILPIILEEMKDKVRELAPDINLERQKMTYGNIETIV